MIKLKFENSSIKESTILEYADEVQKIHDKMNKKRAGGRPRKYTEAEQMQYKINKYP